MFDASFLGSNDVVQPVSLSFECACEVFQFLILQSGFMLTLAFLLLEFRSLQSLKIFFFFLSFKLQLLQLTFVFDFSVVELPGEFFVV